MMTTYYNVNLANVSLSVLYNYTSLDDGNMTCVQDYERNSTTCFTPYDTSSQITVTVLEIVVTVFLSIFILAIIIGNVMVILSVALFRDMRTLTNGLIVSLATADVLVAVVVQPISLQHEVMGQWTLGSILCDFWITSDVFCCTASILNIVVIAVDRYWLITKNVRYTHNTTFPRKRVCIIMLFLAWSISALISSLPLLGWREGSEKDDPTMCIISQDLGYTIISTFGAFWFPLIVILIVYFKIFRVAQKRARSRAKQRAVHPSMHSTLMTEMNGNGKSIGPTQRGSDSNSPPGSPGETTMACQQEEMKATNGSYRAGPIRLRPRPRIPRRPRMHRGRARNSRTLGLIIGGFVFCWLPFFIIATLLPMCPGCNVPPVCFSVVLWLGYSNSLLNPAIYAIWDKNFRRSFKRLTTCDIRWSTIL